MNCGQEFFHQRLLEFFQSALRCINFSGTFPLKGAGNTRKSCQYVSRDINQLNVRGCLDADGSRHIRTLFRNRLHLAARQQPGIHGLRLFGGDNRIRILQTRQEWSNRFFGKNGNFILGKYAF